MKKRTDTGYNSKDMEKADVQRESIYESKTPMETGTGTRVNRYKTVRTSYTGISSEAQ